MRFQQLLRAGTVTCLLAVVPGAARAADRARGDQERPRDERNRQAVERDRAASGQIRFEGMDADNDGVITRGEWKGNDQSFRQQDTNRDGVLSGAEIRVEENRIAGMDADNDGVVTRSEWRGNEQSFREQDTNRDGVLSAGELAPRRAAAPRAQRRDELVAQFTRADRDGDGRLRRGDWTADMGSFAQADANRDGAVTRAEFLALRQGAARSGQLDSATGSPAELRRGTPAFQAGFDRGLADGRQAGKEDRHVNGGQWDLDGQRELEQADAGYEPRLGERVDYQAGYRGGFLRGYTEGFGPR
jgi:Ca2+-binding EF-hand superfamily protein